MRRCDKKVLPALFALWQRDSVCNTFDAAGLSAAYCYGALLQQLNSIGMPPQLVLHLRQLARLLSTGC